MTRDSKSTKRLLPRLLAVGLGLLLAAIGLEVGLRAGGLRPTQRHALSGFHDPHPSLGWLGMPSLESRFRQREFDVLIVHGPDGFRLPEPPNPDPASGRIAILGDSFMWGWGVEQGETMADQLRHRVPDGWAVKSYGVNAFGTGQQALLLESVVLPTQPDRVLLAYFMNDLVDNAHRKQDKRPWFRVTPEGELVPENTEVQTSILGTKKALARRSVALSQLRLAVRRLRERGEALTSEEHDLYSRLPDANPEELWRVQEALLVRMRDACKAAGVPFSIFYIPLGPELANPEHGEGVGDRLLSTCERLGIQCIDLRPGILEAWSESPIKGPRGEPLYYPSDMHWTPMGHRVAAEILAREWL